MATKCPNCDSDQIIEEFYFEDPETGKKVNPNLSNILLIIAGITSVLMSLFFIYLRFSGGSFLAIIFAIGLPILWYRSYSKQKNQNKNLKRIHIYRCENCYKEFFESDLKPKEIPNTYEEGSEESVQTEELQISPEQKISIENNTQLSDEEIQILKLMIDGVKNTRNPTREISKAFDISPSEALSLQDSLRNRIGGDTNKEMVQIALKSGLISINEESDPSS